MEIEIALRKHDLPHEFPRSRRKAVRQRCPTTVSPTPICEDRVDLRDLPLVTIDGETRKDFDDAVYCEPLCKAAPVAKQGLPAGRRDRRREPLREHGDALDREAHERGNSVYFPRRVIPMLPEKLSNGLCSLNPDVDRLCMVCDMRDHGKGAIDAYQFYPAVMHSHARLTYTEVWASIVGAGQQGSAAPRPACCRICRTCTRCIDAC